MASSLKSVINMFARKQEHKVVHFDLLATRFPDVSRMLHWQTVTRPPQQSKK